MTLLQVLGATLIFIVCPLLAFLPDCNQLQDGFKILLKIIKGLAIVGLSKVFFPANPEWDMIALAAYAFGRYGRQQPTELTTLLAGLGLHHPIAAAFVIPLTFVGTTLFRSPQQSRWVALALMIVMNAAFQPRNSALLVMTIVMAGVVSWGDQKRTETLTKTAKKTEYRAFRPAGTIATLDDALKLPKAGHLATALASLKRASLPIVSGWVLYPGDDPDPLFQLLQPSRREPVIIRVSAVEQPNLDYNLEITSINAFWDAIVQCFEAQRNSTVALVVQPKLWPIFYGTASPIAPDTATLEVTVYSEGAAPTTHQLQPLASEDATTWTSRSIAEDIPPKLLQEVASLSDRAFQVFHQASAKFPSKPAIVEWSHDGERLWITGIRFELKSP
ncbi:hypothetical protein [Alkalinema sp. FACHB-956]|uniref:hypothetical protein n=1 Tax=Alkalinema sp. FACHB-956 TaxID=2692768 RepID=UPI001683BDAE|nr:hypothetical protein [Alkalinema sp. FACHB-956]MBD2329001.1 hypothetical protein [Alkalinema sp. FACHB-956]